MPTPAESVAYPAVPTDTLDALTELLERTALVGSVDRARLEEDLLSALHATGVAHDGTAGAKLWHEAADAGPNHKALTLAYRRLAEAPNPLDPAICTAELRPGLNRQLHMRWSSRWRREGRGEKGSLASIEWAALSAPERDEIRAMAHHLETWHKSHVRAERPRKNVLDTLLLLLADIFARHGGSGADRHDLPHSVESQFIQFAALVLAPFHDPTEVSQVALATRWKRMKEAAASESYEDDPGSQDSQDASAEAP